MPLLWSFLNRKYNTLKLTTGPLRVERVAVSGLLTLKFHRAATQELKAAEMSHVSVYVCVCLFCVNKTVYVKELDGVCSRLFLHVCMSFIYLNVCMCVYVYCSHCVHRSAVCACVCECECCKLSCFWHLYNDWCAESAVCSSATSIVLFLSVFHSTPPSLLLGSVWASWTLNPWNNTT